MRIGQSFCLFALFAFIVKVERECAGNIKHGQHREYEGLKKAAEHVEINREYRGQTYAKEGYITQRAGQAAEGDSVLTRRNIGMN